MTSSVSSDGVTGDTYQPGGVAPPLDLELPDRRACLLAAAQAAAGWVRVRRGAWSNTVPDLPVPVRVVVPQAIPSIDHAATDALLSTLALDHAELGPSIDSASAVAPAAMAATDATVAAEVANTVGEPTLAHANEAVAVAEVAVPRAVASMDIHPPVKATGPSIGWSTSDAAHANELDLASAEAFAPFLAEERNAANQAAAARLAEVAAAGTRDSAPVNAMSDVLASPAIADSLTTDEATLVPVELPDSGPGLAARVGQWARAGAASLLPRWPAFAMLAVLAVIGVSARTYWPRLMAPKPGVAVLESVPDGSQVAVDGKALGTTPLTTTLSAGEHSVEFLYKKASRTMRVTITSGGRTVERVDWTKKPSGRLQVHTDPPGAKVFVDGVERGVTPLTLDDLTVGAHAVVLQRAEGSVERSVSVNATEITRLNEMIFPGWVTVFSPFNLNITEGSRPVRLDDRNQVMLPSGSHELRFENRALGYEEMRKVDIKSGAVTTLSIVPPRSSLTVTSSVPGEVWLDGTSVGPTPINALPVELGTREVVLRTPDGDVQRFTVTVTTKPVTLDATSGK